MMLTCATWLALACGGGESLVEPTTGDLEISTVTAGESPDPDGYSVSIDGAAGEAIDVAGTLLKSGLVQGNHAVQLSGVDGNCVVEESNPRTIEVIAGQTVKDTFAITCSTTQGSLAVVTTTTGSAPDADGYTVALDGGAPQAVDVSSTYTFVAVSAGEHTVELGGLAAPCVLGSPNPQTATVTAGGTATLAFSIDCTPPTINSWSPMTSGTDTLYAVWGDAATDVYAVGYHALDDSGQFSESTILRFDGTTWVAAPTAADLLGQLWLTGVSGSSASDVYAVGEGFDEIGGSAFGAILHYDGREWSRVSRPPLSPELEGGLYTVSSSSATEAFAVGFTFNVINGDENATALHFDGRDWSSTTVPGSDHLVLRDIWSKTGAGAFAVGDDNTVGDAPTGAVLRFDGTSWEAVTGAADNPLMAVWGTSASDVFAVGDNGAILHFDGATLAAMSSPTPETLVDVYGNGPSDVFAVGLSGVILHYDGAEWKIQPSGVTDGLSGIWTSIAEAFVVGDGGRILHGVPGGPIAVAASDRASRAVPRVKRDIGHETLEKKWPRPRRLAH